MLNLVLESGHPDYSFYWPSLIDPGIYWNSTLK